MSGEGLRCTPFQKPNLHEWYIFVLPPSSADVICGDKVLYMADFQNGRHQNYRNLLKYIIVHILVFNFHDRLNLYLIAKF